MKILIMVLASVCALSGCLGSKGSQNGSPPINIASITPKELVPSGYDNPDPVSARIAAGANDFSFRLSSALVGQDKYSNENFVFSPVSAWLPLAALANATKPESLPALLDSIGAPGASPAELNTAASRMLYDLTKQRSVSSQLHHNPLRVANAVFVGNDVAMSGPFINSYMDYYRGYGINVDFKSEDAPAAINKWVSDNTDGLITDLVQEFSEETIAAIANAIYFSDGWSKEFDPGNTTQDLFHSPSGNINASFMSREADGQAYYEDSQIQAATLRFASGGGLMVILPKEASAQRSLASMTPQRFSQIRDGSSPQSGKLLLPKFKVESGLLDLKSALESLGVPLFNREEAPLAGLVEQEMSVWVSGAVQKAFIEVDEKGATAAAATAMPIDATSMPVPTEPFEMVCDKPFVFVLFEYTYDALDQVLFTGIVNQP
ncbi:MAG: hypothetical protein FWG10_01120 [Eubacteriaceae bacterium]|nr:hypothetical protein [Eubacteriaceae bacterium]